MKKYILWLVMAVVLASCTISSEPEEVTAEYRNFSERQFVLDSTLRAGPMNIVFTQMEDLNAPENMTGPEDTEPNELAIDRIPYYFENETVLNIEISPDLNLDLMLIDRTDGDTVLEMTGGALTAVATVDPGAYYLYLYSLEIYGGSSDYEATQPIFIQPDKGKSNSAGEVHILLDRNCENADIPYIDLRYSILWNVSLRGSDLSRANLDSADLLGADLSYCKLTEAMIINSRLQNAKLAHSNCMMTNFAISLLLSADLTNVNFIGADFTFSDLTDADIRGSVMCDTKRTDWIISGIISDNTTKCRP